MYSPQFLLTVNWLWTAHPNPTAGLAQIVGVERLIQAIQSGT
jgi:hypothetical protein